MNINIGNVPTELYNQLLEKMGQLHIRRWVDYLKWSLQEPEGEIDFDFLSINGHSLEEFSSSGSVRVIFRSGSFVYEFDASKPKGQQYTLISTMTPQPVRQGTPAVKMAAYTRR